MVFREKAKALFKSKSKPRSSRSDSLSKTSSSTSSRDRHPSNVYAPGEPMPRPKYRKPPTKEHKDKLEAFSFGDAWRKKSFQSQYSPMGTRAPSRRNSLFSLASRRKSYGGRSSRANSITSGDTDKSGVRQREGGGMGMGMGAAMRGTRLSTEAEAEGDDDVTNGIPLAINTLGLLTLELYLLTQPRTRSRSLPRPVPRPRTHLAPPDGGEWSVPAPEHRT